MAKKLYEETDIQAIASAIRGKNGTTETYKTSEMAAAITNLPTSGGSGEGSKGVLLSRANTLPVCLSYFHQLGSKSYYQYHYLSFIWPAGVEYLYLNHDYRVTDSSTDSYKMSEILLHLATNSWATVASSLQTPKMVVASKNIPDMGTNYDGSLTTIVSHTGKLYNATSTFENFKYTLNANTLFGHAPTEDTPCVVRVSTKGAAATASMVGFITVQEEAFE